MPGLTSLIAAFSSARADASGHYAPPRIRRRRQGSLASKCLFLVCWVYFTLGLARALSPLRTRSFLHPSSFALSSTSNKSSFSPTSTSSTYDVVSSLFQSASNSDKRPIILFDGTCNLCNGGVNFVLDNDSKGHFRMAALQSQVGKSLLRAFGKDANDISSIVLVQSKSDAYFKSDAVLRIASSLDSPIYKALSVLGLTLTPRFVRDPIYMKVSKNRYGLFGKSDSCRLSDERYDDRFVDDDKYFSNASNDSPPDSNQS